MNGIDIIAVFLSALFFLLMVGVPIAFGLLLVSAVMLLYIGSFSPQMLAQAVVFGAWKLIFKKFPECFLQNAVMQTGIRKILLIMRFAKTTPATPKPWKSLTMKRVYP